MAMIAPLSPKKRDIPKAGKIVWEYRKVYHHLFSRGIQPVLCNSFQKSGTHLLVNVVASLPQFHHYGRKTYWHYLSRARVDSKKISKPFQVIKTLSQCLQGEIFRGHIAANTELLEFFSHHRFKHLFIFRDLRDVVVSYFYGMKNRKAIDTWPSRYFYALQSDEERLEFLIRGWPNDAPLQGFPSEVDYPNIGERFRENLSWLTDPNCLAIRFEDLVNPETQNHMYTRITRYLLTDISNGEIRELVRKIYEGRNAKNSHTFRKGIPGSWRNSFSEKHIVLFKELAGQMLIDLGYEHDLKW
jgi:hypothetical protein